MKPKTQLLLTFLGGVVSVVAVMIAFYVVRHTLTTQTVISCHTPQRTPTEYCIYHTKTSRLLGGGYELSIGATPGKGLKYAIPYSSNQLSASWDSTTDALTLTMPSTKLAIQRDEYIDSN